jgi:hypothetical protein
MGCVYHRFKKLFYLHFQGLREESGMQWGYSGKWSFRKICKEERRSQSESLIFVAFPSSSCPEDGVSFSWNVDYTAHIHTAPYLNRKDHHNGESLQKVQCSSASLILESIHFVSIIAMNTLGLRSDVCSSRLDWSIGSATTYLLDRRGAIMEWYYITFIKWDQRVN